VARDGGKGAAVTVTAYLSPEGVAPIGWRSMLARRLRALASRLDNHSGVLMVADPQQVTIIMQYAGFVMMTGQIEAMAGHMAAQNEVPSATGRVLH
jgi:hypothetical protein